MEHQSQEIIRLKAMPKFPRGGPLSPPLDADRINKRYNYWEFSIPHPPLAVGPGVPWTDYFSYSYYISKVKSSGLIWGYRIRPKWLVSNITNHKHVGP